MVDIVFNVKFRLGLKKQYDWLEYWLGLSNMFWCLLDVLDIGEFVIVFWNLFWGYIYYMRLQSYYLMVYYGCVIELRVVK